MEGVMDLGDDSPTNAFELRAVRALASCHQQVLVHGVDLMGQQRESRLHERPPPHPQVEVSQEFRPKVWQDFMMP